MTCSELERVIEACVKHCQLMSTAEFSHQHHERTDRAMWACAESLQKNLDRSQFNVAPEGGDANAPASRVNMNVAAQGHAEASALGPKGNDVNPASAAPETTLTFEAWTWAQAFNETLVSLGYEPHDPGWLIGWFANAIMFGYDEASRRRDNASPPELARLREHARVQLWDESKDEREKK